MPVRTIHTSASRAAVLGAVRSLGPLLAGRQPDRDNLIHGLKLRVAWALFSQIFEAFIVKARGGTDAAGIRWAPLSKKYLAYGRRFGPGEQADLKRAAGLDRANRHAPGNQKGLLTLAELKRWRKIYARNLAWLSAQDGVENPKARAAQIAWATLKREGAKTKLDVFGNRIVEIGRDTGVMLNSLSPGILQESGADVNYQPPRGDGGEQQILEDQPGELLCGSNVEYLPHFMKRRPIWPASGPLPSEWREAMDEQAVEGMFEILAYLIGQL